MEAKKMAVYRQGVLIFIILAILTGAEFGVSRATNGSAVLLFIIAFLKAGLIVQFFMHIYRLWRVEEDH
ncbi:MAG: cytochrome C oxidase subunit IV family protein [Candidatus Promineifilaceae bacterium]